MKSFDNYPDMILEIIMDVEARLASSIIENVDIQISSSCSNVSCSHYIEADFIVDDEYVDAFKLRYSDHADRYGSDLTIRVEEVAQGRYVDGDYVDTQIDESDFEALVAGGVDAIVAVAREAA